MSRYCYNQIMKSGQTPYKNVYAGYTVLHPSEEMLVEFSRRIIAILAEYPADTPLQIKTPSQFHITADYRGEVSDLDRYIYELEQRKKSLIEVVTCDGVGTMPSNTTGNCVIFMVPQEEIPFQTLPNKIQHITTIQVIKPEELFRIRLQKMHIIDKLYEERIQLSREEYEGNVVKIDTSKLTVW